MDLGNILRGPDLAWREGLRVPNKGNEMKLTGLGPSWPSRACSLHKPCSLRWNSLLQQGEEQGRRPLWYRPELVLLAVLPWLHVPSSLLRWGRGMFVARGDGAEIRERCLCVRLYPDVELLARPRHCCSRAARGGAEPSDCCKL